MQRVAGSHAHRQTEQLAHEVVLQIGEHHFETVEVRFRADEAGDVVDHERIVAPGQAVAQGLGRGHVDAVMLAVGELAPLAGLEVHELPGHVAQRALGGHRAVAVIEQIDGDVELAADWSVSVPARLWKMISTGAPRSRQASCVLMWASTQICVGAPVCGASSRAAAAAR